MNIVIVGAGEVGRSIAQTLSKDGHDINMVEQDADHARRAEEELDVRVLRGNGARPQVLDSAGVREGCNVDLLIACTDRDEVNMLSSWIAHRAGVKRVISRAKSLEFTDSPTWGRKLGIDMMISPERSVAREILELLSVRTAVKTADLLEGRAALYAFRVAGESPFVGKTLREIRMAYKNLLVVVVYIERADGSSVVPNGFTVVQAGDLCYVVSSKEQSGMLEEMFQLRSRSYMRKVFVVGGGKIGCQLVQRIQREYGHVNIRLIDSDKEKCARLSDEFGDAMVLNADGCDRSMLIDEGIGDADGYVCATDNDELNLVYAAIAKSLGVRKSIAVVRRGMYGNMPELMPVDAVVNTNDALVSVILGYVRYPGHTRAFSIIENTDAEMIEAILPKEHSFSGRTLADIGLPAGVLVALLKRGDKVFIPTGTTMLKSGDRMILFASTELMREAMDMFSGGSPRGEGGPE